MDLLSFLSDLEIQSCWMRFMNHESHGSKRPSGKTKCPFVLFLFDYQRTSEKNAIAFPPVRCLIFRASTPLYMRTLKRTLRMTLRFVDNLWEKGAKNLSESRFLSHSLSAGTLTRAHSRVNQVPSSRTPKNPS